MKALITGSGGLIGSAAVAYLCDQGWEVTGIDNDMRARFFGPAGSTVETVNHLKLRYPLQYHHYDADIRDGSVMNYITATTLPDFIIHAAAQPAHDWAASDPLTDFHVNATGTVNMLEAARLNCPESPFIYTSTSKVYGDNPNTIPQYKETVTRYDYADRDGITETFPIDRCVHSLFGANKLAADIQAQEFGRYFGMPVGIFRGACLTGPGHSAVPLHGYLNYIVKCAVMGIPYEVIGYKGKQVRDQIHANDCISLFMEYFKSPRAGEVYNLGTGRVGSISILETISMLRDMGFKLNFKITPTPRIGDHKCYISDITKIITHFPSWTPVYTLQMMVSEIAQKYEALKLGSRSGS